MNRKLALLVLVALIVVMSLSQLACVGGGDSDADGDADFLGVLTGVGEGLAAGGEATSGEASWEGLLEAGRNP